MQVTARSETIGVAKRLRGMRLSSLMTLIAGAALCFTFVRPDPVIVPERIDAALPCLALATVALVAVRLSPPRPPLEKLFRQSGFLASGVASVLLVGAAAGSLVTSVVGWIFSGVNASGSSSALLGTLFRSLGD